MGTGRPRGWLPDPARASPLLGGTGVYLLWLVLGEKRRVLVIPGLPPPVSQGSVCCMSGKGKRWF